MSRAVWGVLALLVAAVCAASVAAAPSGKRSAPLLVGATDEAITLYGDPDTAFQTLKALHVGVIRVNLYWGGTNGLSRGRRGRLIRAIPVIRRMTGRSMTGSFGTQRPTA